MTTLNKRVKMNPKPVRRKTKKFKNPLPSSTGYLGSVAIGGILGPRLIFKEPNKPEVIWQMDLKACQIFICTLLENPKVAAHLRRYGVVVDPLLKEAIGTGVIDNFEIQRYLE
jgi:hypothetical protein